MLLPGGIMLLPHIHPIIRPPRWARALTERNDASVALQCKCRVYVCSVRWLGSALSSPSSPASVSVNSGPVSLPCLFQHPHLAVPGRLAVDVL